MSKKPNWGHDTTTHHLLEIKVPPPSIIALRNELPLHKEVYDYAIQGDSFEECMARIAEKLDILLDGTYDGDKLAELLTEALRNKRMHPNEPWKRAQGLVAVELVERPGLSKDSPAEVTVELVQEGTIGPAPQTSEVLMSEIHDPANFNPKESPQQEQKEQKSSENQEEELLPSSSESVDSEEASCSDKSDLPPKS